MGSSLFNRENEEDKIQKRAILDSKKKTLLNYFYSGLLVLGTTIGLILSGGLILLLDGGITLAYIISNLIINVYDKIIQNYLQYIPNSKKRDFKMEINKFYENILKDIVNDNDNNKLKDFVNKFIEEENILFETSEKFNEKRNKFLDESKKSKTKFNILVIGKTGSGKSTLINEFLQIRTAQENYGDVGTIGFHTYTTADTDYVLIDSEGLDLKRSVNDYIKFLKNKIIEYNKIPETFIDMIYYCTNNNTRLETEEISVINELGKIYDNKRVPFIIVHTQSLSEEFHTKFKDFVNEKYEGKYPVIKVLARKIDDKEAEGLDDLKNITKQKKENVLECSYYGKFIANVSKHLYSNYNGNILITKIKGFFSNKKEETLDYMLKKIFNMYRFQDEDAIFTPDQKSKLSEFKQKLVENYENNLDSFIFIVIEYNATSDAYYELSKEKIKYDDLDSRISELIRIKKKEFNDFKNGIDTLLYPCLIDILKTKIISYFNQKIMIHLKPEIDKLMAH